MVPMIKLRDIHPMHFDACHDGVGTLYCRSLMEGFKNKNFFIHSDEMPAGVSIGVHPHEGSYEEVYYLLSGKGILTFDGVEYEMQAGDVSLCTDGHSHGFLATENSVLLVVGG